MIKTIARPRRTGRSTEMVILSHRYKVPILTWSREHKQGLEETAETMNLSIPTPLTYGEGLALNEEVSGRSPQILIDDVEGFLNNTLPNVSIRAISIATDDLYGTLPSVD